MIRSGEKVSTGLLWVSSLAPFFQNTRNSNKWNRFFSDLIAAVAKSIQRITRVILRLGSSSRTFVIGIAKQG
jgi:hypothetical protein